MDFQASVQDIDEVTKQLMCSVPQPIWDAEVKSELKSFTRTASIKGFRKGKVPPAMVERLEGPRIRYEAARRVMNQVLQEAFKEHKLDVVGTPKVDLQSVESEAAFEFSAVVEVYPRPTITNYLNRSVQVVKKDVVDADIDENIARLRDSKAEIKPIEDRKDAQKGDVIASSVAISVEGEEAGRPEPFIEELGNQKLPSEVEAQMVGMTVDETKEIEIVAGEDFPNAALQGKKVTYRVSLFGLYSKKLPELNDEFVASLGMGVETVDALRNKVRDDLQKQRDNMARLDAQSAVLDLLAKEHPFKVPASMVDSEIRHIVASYGFAGRNVDPETIDIEPFRSQVEEFALNRLRCAIIIDSLTEALSIKVEESDREALLAKMAENRGMSVEAAKKEVYTPQRIGAFVTEVLRTKTLDHLLSQTTVEHVAELVKDAA